MTEKVKYLSSASIEELRGTVHDNVGRYRSGDFSDMLREGEWSIELQLEADIGALSALDPTRSPEAEISNTKIVAQALLGLTPALACEEGIWIRLTHVECLGFARARWLEPSANDNEIVKAVTDHFFADTLTKRRDDNAISRLWWNAHIARLAVPGPDLKALDVILKKADLRSNFVERSLTVSRPPLAAGIVRIMQRAPWITRQEDNFRAFMRVLNRLGGGIVFEALSEGDIDVFMDDCAKRSGMSASVTSPGNVDPPALAAAKSC